MIGEARQVPQVGRRAVDLGADLGEEHPEPLGVGEVRGLDVAADAERVEHLELLRHGLDRLAQLLDQLPRRRELGVERGGAPRGCGEEQADVLLGILVAAAPGELVEEEERHLGLDLRQADVEGHVAGRLSRRLDGVRRGVDRLLGLARLAPHQHRDRREHAAVVAQPAGADRRVQGREAGALGHRGEMRRLAVEATLELGVAVELREHPVERSLQREAVGSDAREPSCDDVAELRVAMAELRREEVAHEVVVRGEPGFWISSTRSSMLDAITSLRGVPAASRVRSWARTFGVERLDDRGIPEVGLIRTDR